MEIYTYGYAVFKNRLSGEPVHVVQIRNGSGTAFFTFDTSRNATNFINRQKGIFEGSEIMELRYDSDFEFSKTRLEFNNLEGI